MTQQDQEILQLAQRIQFLSTGNKKCRDEKEMFFRLTKICELANALVPRIEENCENRTRGKKHNTRQAKA